MSSGGYGSSRRIHFGYLGICFLSSLQKVLPKNLIHLEHRDRIALKKCLQFVVTKDFPLVLWVLQILTFDVNPEVLHDLRPAKLLIADDVLELLRELPFVQPLIPPSD